MAKQDIFSEVIGAETLGKFSNSELVCRIHGHLYGLPIRSVQEIVPLPEVLPLPQSSSSIIGVCTFREQVIPVLDLSGQLALEGAEPQSEVWQMVVIFHNERLCALAVEEIVEIVSYPAEELEPLPSISEGEEYFFRGIKRTELGMVTLFDMNAVVEHCHLPPRTRTLIHGADTSRQENESVSLVKLGSMQFAVRISEVERIMRSPKIEPMSPQPTYIRGQVHDEKNGAQAIPVVDMYQLLDQEEEAGEEYNLILLKESQASVGFLTGVVAEIRDVNKAEIALVPPLTITSRNEFIVGVVTVDNHQVLLIDLHKIVEMIDGAKALDRDAERL